MNDINNKTKLKLKNNRIDNRYYNFVVFPVLFFLAYRMMYSPFNSFPTRDSGCFMYIGKFWSEGLIPYKDMWDHKGPFLYFLNMLGYILNGKQGILFLQTLFTTISAFYIYKISFLYQKFGISLIISGIYIIMLHFVRQTGNQVEQWALPFISIVIYFFLKNNKNNKLSEKHFAILFGAFCSLVFLIRANLIGFWVIIFFYLLIKIVFKDKKLKDFLVFSLVSFLSFAVISVLFILYFYFNNSLAEFIDQSILFNLKYSSSRTTTVFYQRLLTGIDFIPYSKYIVILYLILLVIKIKSIKQWDIHILSFLSLFFEMYLSTMSGGGHLHYHIIKAISFSLIIVSILNIFDIFKYKYLSISFSVIVLLMYLNEFNTISSKEKSDIESYNLNSMYRERVVDKIVEETSDTDKVLQWGMVDGLNFMSNRKSPSKYFYQYAFDTEGYTNENIINEFITEINTNKPKLIIDASNNERFPYIYKPWRDTFYLKKPELKNKIPKNIDSFYNLVNINYENIGNVGYMIFYKRK